MCVCVFIKLHITAQSGPVIYSFYATVCKCVCCFLLIYSGRQVFWTYQPGSHRRKVTQDSHPPSFCGDCHNFIREKDSAIPFPRRPRSRALYTNNLIVLPLLGIFIFYFKCYPSFVIMNSVQKKTTYNFKRNAV